MTNKYLFEKYANVYDKWYKKNRFVFFTEVEAIKTFLKLKSKKLEIGSGTGRFTKVLNIDFGVEPVLNMLEIAKKKDLNLLAAYGEKLPFKDFSFDTVIIINTLCFVEDPLKVLMQSRRVLKKKGNIVIGMIDKNSFLGNYYKQKNSKFYNAANFFSVEEVLKLLKELDFKKFSFRQTLFKLPEKINKVEKVISGYGKGGFVVIDAKRS